MGEHRTRGPAADLTDWTFADPTRARGPRLPGRDTVPVPPALVALHREALLQRRRRAPARGRRVVSAPPSPLVPRAPAPPSRQRPPVVRSVAPVEPVVAQVAQVAVTVVAPVAEPVVAPRVDPVVPSRVDPVVTPRVVPVLPPRVVPVDRPRGVPVVPPPVPVLPVRPEVVPTVRPRAAQPVVRRRPPRRRARLVLAATAAVLVLATGFDSVPGESVTVRVDFGDAIGAVAADAIGVGVSTYGVSPLTDPGQAALERALDARAVRIPIAFRDGRLTSGAQGAGDVDVTALVRTYRSWGWDVLVVLAGRTNDADIAPGDATRIIRTLGYGDGLSYSTSNEPGQFGLGVAAVVAQATMIVAEGRALFPDFRVWGPAWSTWDRDAFRALARALGPALAGIDYHRYAMGETALDTPAAMALTPTIGDEVATTRRDLAGLGRDPAVAVDELNLTWRYENGVPGGDRRLFTSVATAWLASACGHILVAGGRCLPYAMQNGPLGLTVEPDTPNPDGRAASTPMPAYWGVAAWTGASRFPHTVGRLYRCESPEASIEVFAADNESGGRNLVVVNGSATASAPVTLVFDDIAPGTARTFLSDPARPYDPPSVTAAPYSASVKLTLPPMSVATVVLAPGTS